jgi:hypothetical protein
MGMGIWRHAPTTVIRGNNPATHFKWRLSVSRGRSGRVWKRWNFLDPPGFQPRSAPPVASRYIFYAIPTPYLDRRGMKLRTSGPRAWWKFSQIYCALSIVRGHAMARLIEALRNKPEGHGLDSRWCHWNFHWHNPSGRTMALELTQPLTEMSTSNIYCGVKAAGA